MKEKIEKSRKYFNPIPPPPPSISNENNSTIKMIIWERWMGKRKLNNFHSIFQKKLKHKILKDFVSPYLCACVYTGLFFNWLAFPKCHIFVIISSYMEIFWLIFLSTNWAYMYETLNQPSFVVLPCIWKIFKNFNFFCRTESSIRQIFAD